MGKRIGFWDTSTCSIFDYTLVTHENYEYYQLFLEENSIENCTTFKLKPSVKKNPEIFAWYLAVTQEEDFELDSSCCNSSSSHLICLLKEFLQGFNNLDIDTCKRLREVFSRIDFQNHYMYRTEWLLDELISYMSVLREAFLETSPFDFVKREDFYSWWNQPLRIQQCLNKFQTNCDLEQLKSIQSLQPLLDLNKRLAKGLGQWLASRGLEKLEAASGYFLSLAEYWLKVENYQASLLYVHRSVECILILLGYRERVVIVTSEGLRDDGYERISYSSIFKALIERTARIFSPSEQRFIIELNECRNLLREIHGFRVVKRPEVSQFLNSCCTFLKSLQPDVKAYSYKEKFNIDLQIHPKLFFEVELGIESYIRST